MLVRAARLAELSPPSPRQAYLLMHMCVLLWGLTAILGKVIQLSALPLVIWRMSLVLLLLAAIPATWRGLSAVSPSQWRRAGLAGLFVALHWWTFYGAIKLANASVAVACLAVTPVFLAAIEPLALHRPFRGRELLLALVAVPGVWMVLGGTPPGMNLGAAVGILSALLVAGFATLNKGLAQEVNPFTLTAIEFAAGLPVLAVILLALPPAPFWPSPADWLWLGVLATACTLVPFLTALVALRSLSAWSAQLVVNLEPVYAIALAVLLLGEGAELSLLFYLGAGLLVLTTALAAHLGARAEPSSPRRAKAESGI